MCQWDMITLGNICIGFELGMLIFCVCFFFDRVVTQGKCHNWCNGATITKFGTHVAEHHSEGTMSQIFNLGPSPHFIKSRKLSFKKW